MKNRQVKNKIMGKKQYGDTNLEKVDMAILLLEKIYTSEQGRLHRINIINRIKNGKVLNLQGSYNNP